MPTSSGNHIAYRVLRALSHSQNLRTNTQLSANSEHDAYVAVQSKSFLQLFDKYLDYKDKTVIDIGCGTGNLAITLAKLGARHVVGIDIDQERVDTARKRAAIEGVADYVTFEYADFVDEYQPSHQFDIAFSQSAFEHILSPLACLQKIKCCLAPGGVLSTLFGPLWLSPYGAHMWGFTSVPWVHLLFPERVVLDVRAERFRPDDVVQRYEDIRGHLNRITVAKFKQYVIEAGFTIDVLRLNPAQDKGKYKWVNKAVNAVAPVRELGSHQLLAVLRNPQ